MDNLKNLSYKAFAWDFAGKIAAQSVGFVISIFLARLLSPSDFGLLAMVSVVIGLSVSLIDMGLGVALIQRKEVTEEQYGSVFYFNVTIGLMLATTFFFAAPLVGRFYQNDLLVPIARTMSILFILNSIGNVIRLKLRKELDYGTITKGNLLAAAISGSFGVSLAFGGFGVWSLVIQSLINPIIANIYLFYKINWRPRLIFRWSALKELWGFGFRMFLSGILDNIYSNVDSLIIGKLFAPATLGYYFRARSLNSYVTQYSSGSIMSVLFPALSKLQDEPDRLKGAVFKAYHLINVLAFFLTGLFFVIGAHLIIILFGDKWQESIPMFKLIILTAFAYPLSSILVNILKAGGNSKAFLRLEIIEKIFMSVNFGIGFFWGIEGYLKGNIIVSTLALWANIYFAGKQLKTGQMWFVRITFPYALLTLTTVFIVHNTLDFFSKGHLFTLIAGTITFATLYLIGGWIIRIKGISIILEELITIKIINKIKSL